MCYVSGYWVLLDNQDGGSAFDDVRTEWLKIEWPKSCVYDYALLVDSML